MRAGIFDSGIGGVSVLKSLLKNQIFSEIIYYGDTARVPYGTKDPETIIRYSLEALDFFEPFELDILIIACNTVSVYALEILKSKTKIPVVGVIDSGVLALQNKIDNQDSQILVIATQATIASEAYPIALRKKGYHKIHSIAAPLFVSFVEEGILEGEFLSQCLHHYFKDLDFIPQGIILGCTHYPFIANAIDAYFKHQSILVHPGEAIVSYLHQNGFTHRAIETKLNFFSSEDSKRLELQAQKLLAL